jgi:hypothetical protein
VLLPRELLWFLSSQFPGLINQQELAAMNSTLARSLEAEVTKYSALLPPLWNNVGIRRQDMALCWLGRFQGLKHVTCDVTIHRTEHDIVVLGHYAQSSG